jgi:2-hydroxychromene-2-carboxylate isomerase
MPKSLDFFLFLGSTYTYLSVNRAEDAARRQGVALRWRPFSVRTIMFEQNNRPFVGKPVKMAYMWRDVERRATRHGIPFAGIPNCGTEIFWGDDRLEDALEWCVGKPGEVT